MVDRLKGCYRPQRRRRTRLRLVGIGEGLWSEWRVWRGGRKKFRGSGGDDGAWRSGRNSPASAEAKSWVESPMRITQVPSPDQVKDLWLIGLLLSA